jgi:hypothetical protein
LGVEEVRIDVVVLDKKGNQITDLTADDFEIRQDLKTQKIISSVYINDDQSSPKLQSEEFRNPGPAPQIPAPMLTQEEMLHFRCSPQIRATCSP